ncbi:MAG: DUF2334 domain-containing protein [Clostridia bacterium]|nr:DUF2334 domain-containing protein [Clostridia bacterium]
MKYPIIVRMDDVCPGMDMDRFDKYIQMLDSFGVRPLLGIVPDCQDAELNVSENDGFWDVMRRLRDDGYPIAMHGVNHLYSSREKGLICRRRMSEFAGLEYDVQFDKLNHGKEILEQNGLPTDVFFAPGHSYDRTTLRALCALGFRFVSDGKSRRPYVLDGIKCIPCNGPFKVHLNRGILTICVHCCAESERAFSELRAYLEANRRLLIPWSEAVKLKERSYFVSRFEERFSILIDRMISIAAEIKKSFRKQDIKRGQA